jgi:UDPglucose 6-dehydrogenase
MKISVIGLGKLGFPMSSFLRSKFEINGYDKNIQIRSLIKKKPNLHLPYEANIKKYTKKKIRICQNIVDALKDTDICFITVPTPSLKNGKFSNNFLIDVLKEISKFIKNKDGIKKKPFIININSTVSPGSFDKELIPFMEKNGLKINKDYEFIYNPYFVALGDVIKNLEKPDFILLGGSSAYSLNKLQSVYNKLYKNPNYKCMNLNEGELVKLLVNCYVASKISFTNFVKNITESSQSISLNTILNAIGTDKRIGNNFLRPGGPFLGPCLPRDIVALTKFCDEIKINKIYPNSAEKLNKISINNLINLTTFLKKKKIKSIGFTGIAYKPNTDFYQESIAFKLMEKAKKIGLKTIFFDRYIHNKKIKFSRVDSLKSLIKKCDVIFISYEDSYVFKRQKIFNQNVYVWDIFNFLSLKSIKKFSNKNELNNLFKKKNYEK